VAFHPPFRPRECQIRGGKIGRVVLMRALLAAALVLPALPAAAQFYKNKTLTLLVNFGVGAMPIPRHGSISTTCRDISPAIRP